MTSIFSRLKTKLFGDKKTNSVIYNSVIIKQNSIQNPCKHKNFFPNRVASYSNNTNSYDNYDNSNDDYDNVNVNVNENTPLINEYNINNGYDYYDNYYDNYYHDHYSILKWSFNLRRSLSLKTNASNASNESNETNESNESKQITNILDEILNLY